MDKALDELITTHPKKGGRAHRGGVPRRGSARAQILGNAPVNPATRARAAAAAAPATTTPQPADKIIVSNLPQDVNEVQIKELFASTVGPLREVNLHHDAQGKSKGVAAVHFQRKGDGSKAYQQYNNRLIDGKRPMKIEIVVDPARPQSLASRVAPAPAAAAAPPAVGSTRGAGAARGTGAGRGRGGRRKGAARTPKTAADLDAEMEDYTASNAPAAAPAAAA